MIGAAADRVVKRMSAISFRQLIDEVYFPMLQQVGEGWCSGEISVAQEHFVSAFTREQLVAMLLSVEGGPEHGPQVICAGYPTEQHDLGLLALSVMLAMKGKRVVFLGAGVPLEDLCRMLAERTPEMTCVSVMLPRSAEELRSYARELSVATRGRVVIGGRGLPAEPPAVVGVEWHQTMEAIL